MNITPYVTSSTTLSTSDALTSYLRHVKTYSLLSTEEEKSLFKRFHQNNDLDAARKIVQSHLRFVAYIAKSYVGYGLPLEDIIQEGNLGLMKSVKRFDLAFGVRFATFASHWIKAEINEYVLRNWRLVKIATTKAQRKLFFNLRKAKTKLARLTSKEINQIAKELKVAPTDVIEMESRLHQNDCFFDETFGDQVKEEGNSFIAKSVYLEDHSSQPDTLLETHELKDSYRKSLQKALKSLDERRRDIIMSRWLAKEKISLKELSVRYGVSEERIRQIEKDAMGKIRVSLQEINENTN